MGEAARRIQLSWDEYLKLEQETGERHELLNGEAWAMAGGTGPHSDIKVNVAAFFRAALRGRPCRPRDSDFRVYIPETGLATYPDLSVFCGTVLTQPGQPASGTNPTLLVEVLSESTEAWDRGGKFAHYRQIPSLRYYLLVNQDPRRVELYTRNEDGSWTLTVHEAGAQVPLPALGVVMPVDELYEDLLPEQEAPQP